MTCTNFPSAGLVIGVTTHQVGEIIYLWSGVVWEAISVSIGTEDDVSVASEFLSLNAITTSSDDLPVGKMVTLKERVFGGGGEGISADIITKGASVGIDLPNGIDIIDLPNLTGKALRLRVRDEVDSVALGINGTLTDKAAITRAFELSKTVIIPSGHSCLLDGLDMINAGSTLKGEGTVIKSSTAFYGIGVKAKNCTIKNLVFEGEQTSGQPNSDIKMFEGADNTKVTGNTFKGNGYSAVIAQNDEDFPDGETPYTNPVSGVMILDNIFEAQDKGTKLWYVRPLTLTSISNITIANNIFRDTGFDAIRTRTSQKHVTIVNNQFIDIGDADWPDAQTRDAIDTAFDNTNLLIHSNQVFNAAFAGFDLKGAGTTKNNFSVIVTNNLIQGTRREGISFYGIDGDPANVGEIIIQGNILSDCNQADETVGDACILVSGSCRNMQIKDNQLSASFGRGINMSGGSPRYLSIIGNHITNCGDVGINLLDVKYCNISDNMIINDSDVGNPNSMEAGIRVVVAETPIYPRTGIMRNNIVANTTAANIQLGGSAEAIDQWIVYDNNVEIGTFAYTDNSRIKGAVKRTLHATSTPEASDGAFEVGDKVYFTSPVSAIGAVCTVAGVPGTWKTFGDINP